MTVPHAAYSPTLSHTPSTGPNRSSTPALPPNPHTVSLARGAQVVINGAIVTATAACSLEVGSGAFVLTGRSLWRANGPGRDPLRNPSEELYFSLLDASVSDDHFEAEQFRLFALLAQVVIQQRTHEAQQECALCASALIAGNAEDATRSAARLASGRLKSSKNPIYKALKNQRIPGQMGSKRSSPSNQTAPRSQLQTPAIDSINSVGD